jgi:CxxC motif-containing protein (DUF1111 family)
MLLCDSKEKNHRWALKIPAIAVSFLLVVPMMQAQTDPGVRAGADGAGGSLPGMSNKESSLFNSGLDQFQEVQSVTGSISGTEAGLGPRFNLDSCSGCHSQPAVGGSSPQTNPQVEVATKNGASNTVPFFVSINGPIREARFKYANPPTNTIRDGGVHDLFTIAGRTDAPGCSISQPNFNAANNQHNLVFRIPTPVFGGGLIEAINDSTILANKTANAAAKAALGISGHENREGNAGTITRFGWKAQNKSLIIFAAEAYNVEQGITNELFPQEREETPACLFNKTPEDHISFAPGPVKDITADTIGFADFMRFLAPPTPACGPAPLTACSDSINRGATSFSSAAVGCALCHRPSFQTGNSPSDALNDKTVNLFSDLLVHHMGTLADDIIQGSAGPDEFRTAPLWGLGKRIFFLHDGRTTDLLEAIQLHSSAGSEASGSVAAFNALPAARRQDILNFLRSL